MKIVQPDPAVDQQAYEKTINKINYKAFCKVIKQYHPYACNFSLMDITFKNENGAKREYSFEWNLVEVRNSGSKTFDILETKKELEQDIKTFLGM